MSAPVTQAEREAWLTRAEHDLAAMRAWATELERRFAALRGGCRELAGVRSTDVEPKTSQTVFRTAEAFDG